MAAAAPPLRIGVAGAGGGRAAQLLQLRASFEAHGAQLSAVCDPSPFALAEAAETLGLDLRTQGFAGFSSMLDGCTLDAVLISSPMEFHAAQSIDALGRGLHVLCEVTAAVSIAECHALVEAAERSPARYMMAENYYYARFTRYIAGLVERGRFGEPHYAEGEYLIGGGGRAMRGWRRHWMAGRKGITYGTHVLAPLLAWFPGDRVCSVCCIDSGAHYSDDEGVHFASDGAVMLGKTQRGRLLKLRLDMVSTQVGGQRHVLQGTRGTFEMTDGNGRLALLSETADVGGVVRWEALEDAMDRDDDQPVDAVDRAVRHIDLPAMVGDFVRLCRGEISMEITGGVHGAMDLTLPGLVSEVSAESEGEWLPVPDSRGWVATTPASHLTTKL
jgi:predicted dehydrogenase